VSRPIATIVVTTRDRAALCHRAVSSALRQTIRDVEVVVVDDGSVEAFRPAVTDARLRVVRHDRPRGVCEARNAGLSASTTEWVTFLDDDDELLPSMVAASLNAAASSELPRPVAVLSTRRDVDAAGRAVATQPPVTLPRGRHYFLEDGPERVHNAENTLFAPTAVLRAIGGWDGRISAGWEHDDLLLRLNAACSLQGVAEETYVWHDHAGPRRHRAELASAEGMARTLEKHAAVFDRHPGRAAHYRSTMGVWYLKAGRWGPAVVSTTGGVLLDPSQPRLWLWWLASLTGPRGLAFFRAGRRALTGRVRRSRPLRTPAEPARERVER
jgi:glycosyltransferase involved in cell wall biosynthesis